MESVPPIKIKIRRNSLQFQDEADEILQRHDRMVASQMDNSEHGQANRSITSSSSAAAPRRTPAKAKPLYEL